MASFPVGSMALTGAGAPRPVSTWSEAVRGVSRWNAWRSDQELAGRVHEQAGYCSYPSLGLFGVVVQGSMHVHACIRASERAGFAESSSMSRHATMTDRE